MSSLSFHQGPVVAHTASFEDAAKVLADEGVEWLGITVDGCFSGWARADDVRSAAMNGTELGDVERFLPAAQVAPSSTLRAAMELIMSSNTSVAVIDDGGHFGGVVTLEDIRRSLAREP